MKVLAPLVWLMFAGVQVLQAVWFAKPERYRVKISDMAQRVEGGPTGTGLPRWKFVRGAWAFWSCMSVIAIGIAPEVYAVAFGASDSTTDPGVTAGTPLSTARLVLLVAIFALVVALLVLLLVVMNTGRPRILVLTPCRGMTPQQIEAWLEPRINLWARKREPKH